MDTVALGLVVGSGLSTLGLGIFHPRVSLFGPVVWRGPRHRREIALTFDDGPDPSFTPRIAAVLAEYDVRATFFCVGQEVERNRTLAVDLHAAGHELGNHTYRHDTGGDLFVTRRLLEDLRRCQDLLATLTGRPPSLYRPAVGIRNPTVHAAARALDLTIVTWSGAARDGLWTLTSPTVFRLANKAQPGHILALHDGVRGGRTGLRESTVQHLPLLIARLRDRGFQLVTVSHLLRP